MTPSEQTPDSVPDVPIGATPAISAATASTRQGAVMVAATFTADGIQAPLAFLLEAAGLSTDVRFAPYHQVFQQFLTPQSELAANVGGINVVLLRLEDFLRDLAPGQVADEVLARTSNELVDAARQFVRRCATPCIFVVLRASPEAVRELPEGLAAARSQLEAALNGIAGAVVLHSGHVDPLCGGDHFDPVADRLAHIPYTDEYLAALAIAIARAAHMLRVPAHKVLVLDCDNTIWRGVVGEDGPEGIGLDAEFLGVQQFAVDAQAKGALVCLASKNAQADVIEVLTTRADMVLKAEHIVSHRVNWDAKAGNLRSLARELNLGLDSFVFVDDNPVECGQMREALPEVVTLQLPPPGQVTSFLDHLWAFDKVSVTQEDARRTSMYRENAARENLEAEAGDIGEFLAALELVIDIGMPNDDEWPRVAQLTQRTNQFNFTTVRRSEADMRALAATGADVLAVRVRDRFGDYGLVGVVIAAPRETALEIDTFLLSCRVLGRGVEHAIVAKVGELALAGSRSHVRLPFKRTPKNEPARGFADAIVGQYRQGEGDAFAYVIPAEVAAAISHRPGEDAAEVIEARRADAKKPAVANAAQAGGHAGRSERYTRLATVLTSGQAVLDAIRATSTRERDLAAPSVPASNDTERAVLALWEEILGLRGLGVEDDYFALGGSSLQAARLFAEMAHRLGVSLPLTTILEAPTVKLLAARMDGAGDAPPATGLIALRGGGRRKLFLVHDGDGETLLYRNLAQRAPADLSVFGIPPVRLKGVPLAHDSIEAMAASYIASMRAEQPAGPYLIGGMCAGGLIAYEMAVQLERAGESVQGVLMMDSATPQAARKPPNVIAYRKARLAEALADARAGREGVSAGVAMAGAVGRKIVGVLRYETDRFTRRWTVRARFALLRRVLAGRGSWPGFVRPLSFRAIYNVAESFYVPGRARAPVLLLRARHGSYGDTGYVHLYQDAALGWSAVAGALTVVDVDGGHASMLQEPHAEALADAVRPHWALVSGAGLASAGTRVIASAQPGELAASVEAAHG